MVLYSFPISNCISSSSSAFRPSTRTSRPENDNTNSTYDSTSCRTHNDRPARWQYPDRHVLIIINFQDLADLSSRLHPLPNNADRLDAECRVHLDAIDEVSLFTWCRHFDHREVIQIPIGNLCHLISTRIRETWDIRIPGTALELRGSDYWGDTVQLAADRTIAETLDAWAPRWRELQYTSTSWQALPQCPCRPFNLALILSSSHSRSHPPLKSVRIEQKRISALRRLFNTSYQIGIPGVT